MKFNRNIKILIICVITISVIGLGTSIIASYLYFNNSSVTQAK
jgi:hypothetical protein